MPGGDGASAKRLVRFTFDGHDYEGVEGEPLAASLLAADRLTLSRSFRFHRPRGLMCSTGQCGWCDCEVDGVPSVRSCRVPVRDGLVARGEHAWPSVECDLLSLVGLVSRWIPPTFYHHRFLRPRGLRKRYLDVLRWFGGRGRLAVGGRVPDRAGRPTRRIDTDVLVVGGGRAGLFAALGAAEAGGRVTVIEAEAGIGVGWRRPGDGAGRAIGTFDELAAAAEAAGVRLLGGVAAVGWYGGLVAAIAADAHLEIRSRAIVAATGSYDRVPLVPGGDRPGVMAARTVIGLVERFGIRPGDRAVLVGTGSEIMSAGEALTRAGATELIGPIPTDALVSIGGGQRVASAVIQADGATRRLDVDLVIFGDRNPNLDLILAAGATVGRRDDVLVPTLDPSGRTSVAALFAVGSAAGLPILDRTAADAARATGRLAAAASAGRAAVEMPAGVMPAQPPPSETAGHSHPSGRVARGAIICFCEDVRAWEIRTEVATGYADPELVKRRTGALTGPCQGKYCLQSFACLVGDTTIPTARPPLRPVRLGDLIASEPGDPEAG